MTDSKDNPIDWEDDDPIDADGPKDSTLWGETMINEAIHEANQMQRDPETYIEAKKAGEETRAESEFRTVYRKESSPGFFKKLIRLFGKR
ncbi:MAG: hypothetical protein AAF514_08025 [Verrucomicrobiota bacterium]